jgi:hypothetical protein
MLPFDLEDLSQKSLGRKYIASQLDVSPFSLQRFYKKATAATFKRDYNNFVDHFSYNAKLISDLKPDGVGPGELIAYLIFDNLTLGGKNSNIDFYTNGKPFAEMKAGAYSLAEHALIDFKITKDGDAAVNQLSRDLEAFNNGYRKITQSQLSHWHAGHVPTTVLREWRSINLKSLARKHAGPIRGFIDLRVDVNGIITIADTDIEITHLNRPGWEQDIIAFMQSKVEIPVDNRVSSLQKIEKRWVAQAFKDYLDGKRMALVCTKTLKMMYFGTLTKEMVGLYRVGRNQPAALVRLPK